MENTTTKNQINLENNNKPHDKIFEILFDKDEITWRTILFDLVKTEQMDLWDIDIGLLTKRYIEMLRTLKELNFRVSGKVLLAAALLLRIKSERLVGKDIDDFDRLLTPPEEEDFLYEEVPESLVLEEKHTLIPRTPQPRKRKVSIYDLVDALQKALEVKRRRVIRSIPAMDLEIPKKKKDISKVIGDLYLRIKKFFTSGKKKKLTFTTLVPSDKKEDKVFTFVPLLHLSNQRKVQLYQEEHFGEIEILLRTKQEVDKELSVG